MRGKNDEAVNRLADNVGKGTTIHYNNRGGIMIINTYIEYSKYYTSRSNPELFEFEVGYLNKYPKIGNTYNYAYNEMFGSDYIAHFYFDMLTYYWWESTLELYNERW